MIVCYHPAENEEDFEKLKPMVLELFNGPDAHEYLSHSLVPFDEKIVTEWLKTHRENGIEYFVSHDSKKRINGIIVMKSDRVSGCELIGLVVRPDQRQQGVGEDLLIYALKQARKNGYRAVDASVYCDNKHMLRLMLKLDFIPINLIHRVRADGADVMSLKCYLA